MKVILLAAGRSKRLKPIEDKNFLNFLEKPLIEHQIEQLYAAGLRDIILVGGAHNLEKLKATAKKIRSARADFLKIVEQKKLDDGMAGALLAVEKYVKKEPILVVSANDIVDQSAYKLIFAAAKDKRFESFLLGKKVNSYFPGGYLKTKNGRITSIIEKPGAGKEPSNMVNLVVHYHRESAKLFEVLHKTKSSRDDRYEVALDTLIKKGFRMKAVPYAGFWKPIKYPWDVLTVMEHFLGGIEKRFPQGRIGGKKAEVAKSATIRGTDVYLEDGVRILDNAVIVGPAYIGKNTLVASNTLVRESHIGANCVIGFGSEIARSYLGSDVWTHSNYIGDSIIGSDCSFGSGTVMGNLRLDEGNILVDIQGEKVDSGRTKFGLIAGDHVRCGINTSFMPGIKIGRNCFIGAGIVVAQDVPDNQYVYAKTELIMKENKAQLDNKKRGTLKKKLR